jgi:outer membrane protein OmpA-like peptidoglycan-associated protein
MTKQNYRLNEYVAQQQNISPVAAGTRIGKQAAGGQHGMLNATNDGAPRAEILKSLANRKGQNGQLTQNANIYGISQQRGEDYTQVVKKLNSKIQHYLDYGYFGNNQEVINTITEFQRLLLYCNGRYELNAKRAYNADQNHLEEGIKDYIKGLRYKDQNQYGLQQKITRDDSGSEFAVNGDTSGQWMVDLQSTLQEFLQIGYIYGPKTVEATNAFIEFLNVEKRSLFGFLKKGQFKGSLKKLALATAAALAMLAAGNCSGTQGQQQQQLQQQPTTNPQPMIQQYHQQSADSNTGFDFDSSQVTQHMSQTLRNLQSGNYVITITNARGGNAQYNQNLYQQRVNSIKQNLPNGVTATFNYGGINDNADFAAVNITPAQMNTVYGAFGESKIRKVKRINETQLRRMVGNIISEELNITQKKSDKMRVKLTESKLNRIIRNVINEEMSSSNVSAWPQHKDGGNRNELALNRILIQIQNNISEAQNLALRSGDRQLADTLRSISRELGQYVKQGPSDYIF